MEYCTSEQWQLVTEKYESFATICLLHFLNIYLHHALSYAKKVMSTLQLPEQSDNLPFFRSRFTLTVCKEEIPIFCGDNPLDSISMIIA